MSFNVFTHHYRQNYAKYFGCGMEGGMKWPLGEIKLGRGMEKGRIV